jgi:hypothetical protein
MGTKRGRAVPARLEGLRRRFERWRRTRTGRTRIPEPLWASAVKLAGTYGIHRTARALRVDYYTLKKRLEEAAVVEKRVEAASAVTASRVPAGAAGATFVELPAAAWPGSGECTVELEDARGAKMRVQVKGFGAPDLAALSRSFWQSQS